MKNQAAKKIEHKPYAWYQWGNEKPGMVSVWWRDAVSGNWGHLPEMLMEEARKLKLLMVCPFN